MDNRVICVVGPTATGKSKMGVALAKRFGGEVVSVDSMQIYRGMTIGTAAPTAEEMDGVRHHMVDVYKRQGLKIVLMVFGAFVILNLLRDTGAINEVKGAIARISDDRRVQVVIVGMMLPIFLEGAAGAGSPAAIAAPFLVAPAFAIILGVYMVLTMLYTCVLFPHFGM